MDIPIHKKYNYHQLEKLNLYSRIEDQGLPKINQYLNHKPELFQEKLHRILLSS